MISLQESRVAFSSRPEQKLLGFRNLKVPCISFEQHRYVRMRFIRLCSSRACFNLFFGKELLINVFIYYFLQDRLFPLWDWVGGRYSVCSSVGALPLSRKYGFQQFDSFMAGETARELWQIFHACLHRSRKRCPRCPPRYSFDFFRVQRFACRGDTVFSHA